MTGRTRAHLSHLAHAHLDPTTAERWLGLLRPAVQLRAAGPGQPVLARLGGVPDLPPDVAWPEWPGQGPLSFVVEVDLTALAGAGLDTGLVLPTEGRLLGFYFDDPEGTGTIVYSGDPETLPGSRLLHVIGTGPASDPAVELTGEQVLTWPGLEHQVLEEHDLGELDDLDEALVEILERELGPDVWGHQLGGWAHQVQGDVELEAAEVRLGAARYDQAHHAEAARWRPLVQVDSDDAAGTSWGDAGCLYWLARSDGTSAVRIEDTAFTWQCS